MRSDNSNATPPLPIITQIFSNYRPLLRADATAGQRGNKLIPRLIRELSDVEIAKQYVRNSTFDVHREKYAETMPLCMYCIMGQSDNIEGRAQRGAGAANDRRAGCSKRFFKRNTNPACVPAVCSTELYFTETPNRASSFSQPLRSSPRCNVAERRDNKTHGGGDSQRLG